MTMTLNGTSGITFPNSTTQVSAGKLLQVVSTTKTDIFSTTSTSYTDVSGLSVSITPTSSSSKILVIVTVAWSQQSGPADGYIQLLRGSTAIGNSTGTSNASFASVSGGVNADCEQVSINYLDSPSTTSSTTYKIQTRTSNGSYSNYVNRRGFDTANGGSSTITVMEIAG